MPLRKNPERRSHTVTSSLITRDALPSLAQKLGSHRGHHGFHTSPVGIDQLATPIASESQDDDPDHTKTESERTDFFEPPPLHGETQPQQHNEDDQCDRAQALV